MRYLLWLFFASSAVSLGIYAAGITLTVSAIILGMATGLLLYQRQVTGRPMVPAVFLQQPMVIAAALYMFVGLLSGFFIQDGFEPRFFAQIIQRSVVLVLPLFVFSLCGLRPIDLQRLLLSFLPLAVLTALLTFALGASIKFSEPIYIQKLDLHKNQIGAICATLLIVCAAFILTGQRKRWQPIFIACSVAGLLGLLGCQSRGGFLSAAVGGFFMVLSFRRVRVRYMVAWGLGIMAGIAICLTVLPQQVVEKFLSTEEFSPNEERLHMYGTVSTALEEDPITPRGWGSVIFVRTGAIRDPHNVLLLDWLQMGPVAPLILLALMALTVHRAFCNGRMLPQQHPLAVVNMAALGIFVARFFQGMLDVFWVGRGQSLTTFTAAGIILYIHFLLASQRTSRPLAK